MKNRSNIAASILQNPELLEQAYIASQNSQGVGQKEFDVYAQSITARMAELKNRLQELAAVTIDSQWIKDLVSFGTSAIKTITKLSKTFGGLNLAIGGALGFLLQKTGYGITSFDKLTGTRSYGLTRIGANIKNSLTKAFGSFQIPKEISDYFSGVDPNAKLLGEGGLLYGKFDTAPQALQDLIRDLPEVEKESLTAGKAMQHLGTSVVTVGSAFDGLKNIALNALSTLGTMAIVVAATWAAGAVFKAIDEYMHRAEIAIEKGKEAQAQIAEINEGFSKQQKTVANFDAERFVDLSSRKNDVSFTTDEYNELAEVSNQLIELFPSLAGEFDSQGNAVVNLGGNVEEVTTKLADLLAQERELADFKITQNLPDVVAGIGYQNDALYKEIEEQNKVIESYKETQGFLREGKDVETANLSLTDNGFRVFAENANEGDLNFREIIEEAADRAWKESGVAFRNTFSTDVYNATTGKLGSYEYFDLGAIGEEEAEKFWSAFKIAFTDMSKETDINLADALKIKAADEREIRANWNSIKPSLISAMNTDVSFFDLQGRGDFGKQMRDTIVKNLNNVDIMDMIMSGDYEEFEKNPRRWVRQKFIDPITNAFYDNEGNYNAGNQGLVEQLLRLDSSDLNTKEYRKKVMEIVKQIFPEDLAERQQFLVSLGIRDADYNFEADNMINELAEATGVSAQEIREGVGQKDLHLLYNVYAEGKMDFKGKDFEQLLKYIETLNAEQAGNPEGVLSEVFNDEGYKKNAETYEKAASTLSSSMDTIRQNGKLTAEEMRDLQEDFPDLTDFSYDGLSTKLAKNMTNWVDEIRSHWKEMGFEGQEQMETYVRNLIHSYGENIKIADEDLNDIVLGNLISKDKNAGIGKQQAAQEAFNETYKTLSDRLTAEGLEVDNRVIWELIMEDEFTGSAQEVYNKYKDRIMNWKVHLDFDAQRALLNANAALEEAQGHTKGSDYYNSLNEINRGELEKLWKEYFGADTEEGRRVILTNIRNLEAENAQNDNAKDRAQTDRINAAYQDRIKKNNKEISDIQRDLSDATITNTEDMYRALIDASDRNLGYYNRLSGIYERKRDEAWSAGNLENYRYYEDLLTENESKITEIVQQQREWNDAIEQMPLTNLQDQMTIIQDDAQKIQDEMSFNETRGIKNMSKEYAKILSNSKEQVKNLREQNRELYKQRGRVEENSDKWKEINNTIRSNNNEIAKLEREQYTTGQDFVMASINNAMANINALDTAMSKGHLSDAESILTLIRANRDYADVLTSTTTGVYADAQALAQLKEEELDLIVAQTDAKKAAEWANYEKNEQDMLSLARAIDPTIETIDQLYDALMRNPDNPQWARIMDMAETNQGILQTIDQLQAAKEEALALSSALGKYQNALSTPNWSDPMQTIRGGMEGAKKLWDQGWVGRDDFTTFANLIATNAEVDTEDAIINFEKNYERMSKYLTEDTSGVHKWVDDMTEKASKFVKMGKDGVEFFDVDNMKEFADLMGTSTEMAEYMLMAMKDAGYNVDISRIGDEFSRTFDTIEGTEANAKQLIKNLVADMKEAAGSGVDISTSADAAAESFQRLRDAGVDEKWIREQIGILNDLGKDNGFHIDPQTLEVTTKVDRAELDEAEKDATEPKVMPIITSGSLTHRREISTQKLEDVGWELKPEDVGGKATVYSSTYDNGKGQYVVMTPILPNGDVLEPESLQHYAEDVVMNGDVVDIGDTGYNTGQITLGFFNSAEEAQNYCDTLHLVQEAYYDNDEAFNQYLNTLRGASAEDFDKISFGDGQYAEGVEQYEIALDGLISKFGLTQEQGEMLLTVLGQMGLIDYKPNIDTTEIDNAKDEVENLPTEKEITIKYKRPEDAYSTIDTAAHAERGYDYSKEEIKRRESEAKYNDNKESQQPVIDSVTDVGKGIGESVDTGTSKITNAINDAATTVATAITGEPVEGGTTTNNGDGYRHPEEGYNKTNTTTSTSSGASSAPAQSQSPPPFGSIPTNLFTAVATVDYKTGNTEEVEETTEELTKPEEKEVEVNIKQKGETGVKNVTSTNTVETNMDMSGLDTGLQMLHSIHPVVPIDGDSKGFMGESAIVKQEKGVLGQAVNIPVRAQDQASGVINSIINTVNSIPLSKVVSVSTKISGMPQLENLRNVIGGLKDKFVNIFNQVHTTAVGGGGATGTAHVSHATGTAYSMWEGYRHSIGAYANGTSEDWALPRDEAALVNEVGTESIVRDGKFFTIPGGAHIEQLKKNDIVFSAAQTAELIRYGKVYSGGGHGKVAYANGTAYNTLNARASGQISRATTHSTRLSDISRRNVGASSPSSSAPASNGAINQNTEATKANTKAANKASGSLDAFKNWVETLFDWIEVRVERLTYKIDLSQARSENTNGYSGKNKQLDNAMKVIGALGTKRNTKTNRWSGGSGLLQDAQNGAIRYMEQATKVRQKAIANGLVDAKTADNIIKLIKEGAINISEYNEKTREFIQNYKEWYDRSLELTSQIEELKQQLKELEQTKLDNITTQFEDLAGYSSAVQATSNAIVDFYTAQGRQVNAGSVKLQYEKQIEQQNAITAAYKKERAAYMAEMKNAEKIFGKTSNEYIEAQTKLEEINQALTESETAYRDLNKQLRELDISRIEAFIDRISSFSDKLESILSLRELRGGKVVEGNYNQQISTNNDLIQRYYQDINRRRAIIKEFGWRTDSENYQEYFDAIVKDEQAIFDLLEANEKLKESIVTLRWKPFNELQNLIKEAVADYDHLRSLFKDKQLFDEEDGIFMTNKGYASLALLGAQLEATKQQIADYRKALDKVQEDYDNGNITLDKYNETSREYIEIIQNSVKSVQQYNDAITELYKTQITNENAALQETISLRKKALQSKKA